MTVIDGFPISGGIDPPVLLRRADLLLQGFLDNRIRGLTSTGTLIAIIPGVYLRAADAHEIDLATLHRAVVGVMLPRLAGEPVVSHESAAILHGLSYSGQQAPPLHVTRAGSWKSRRTAGVWSHRAILKAQDITRIDGIPVTSAARTVLDCALTMSFDHALAVAHIAVDRGQVTHAGLAAQLAQRSRTPGRRAAAAVLARAAGEDEAGARWGG